MEVAELGEVLLNVSLKVDFEDRWIWLLAPADGYLVCDDYRLFTTQTPYHNAVVIDLIWHKNFSLKVSLFAWRLLRNRLPTEDNLFRCHIIPQAS